MALEKEPFSLLDSALKFLREKGVSSCVLRINGEDAIYTKIEIGIGTKKGKAKITKIEFCLDHDSTQEEQDVRAANLQTLAVKYSDGNPALAGLSRGFFWIALGKRLLDPDFNGTLPDDLEPAWINFAAERLISGNYGFDDLGANLRLFTQLVACERYNSGVSKWELFPENNNGERH